MNKEIKENVENKNIEDNNKNKKKKKYTYKNIKKLTLGDKIRTLNKINLSINGLKKRNIEKLNNYNFIAPIYTVKMKIINEDNFNSLVDEINEKIKEKDNSLPKLEKLNSSILDNMCNPQFITINPRSCVNKNELFDELHNIFRCYYSDKLGKRWFNNIDEIPNFYLFEENGRARDIEKHLHYHLLIDIDNIEADELKDYLFYNLFSNHKGHSKIIRCNDLKNVNGIYVGYKKHITVNGEETYEEVCRFPQHHLYRKKENIIINENNKKEKIYSITYLKPKYSKLDIDVSKATNDGIYSYLVKEDVMDAKKQLLGLTSNSEPIRIYSKEEVLFANS